MQLLTGCAEQQIRQERYEKLIADGMSPEQANEWLDTHQEEWDPNYEESPTGMEEGTEKPTM